MDIARPQPPAHGTISVMVHDLSATGVVRNAIAIANRLHREGLPVELLACRAEGTLADELDPTVPRVSLLGDAPAGGRGAELARAVPALRRHVGSTPRGVLLSTGNHGHLTRWLGGGRARRIYRISNAESHDRPDRPSRPRLGDLGRKAVKWLIGRRAARLVLVGAQLGGAPDRTVVISNGVDCARVRARATEPCDPRFVFADGVPTVVAIGRLATQKNHATLIRAVAAANRTRDLRLLIVGNGSAHQREALNALAAQLGIAGKVTIEHGTANPFPVIARAAVVALPSWWEGASNVLLEAMACGRPVVAARTAGNATEVLGDGAFGLLVDPAAPAAMASALLRQVGPAPVLPGDRAARFDLARTMDAYVALVRDVLADRPAAKLTPRGRTSLARLAGALAFALAALLPVGAAQGSSRLASIAEAVNMVERQLSGRVIEVDLETRDNRLVYEVELVRGGRVIEVLVDARSGQMIGVARPRLLGLYRRWFDGARLGAGTAIQPLGTLLMAIEAKGRGRVQEASLKIDGERPTYEIEVGAGSGVATVSYDAISGQRLGIGYEDD